MSIDEFRSASRLVKRKMNLVLIGMLTTWFAIFWTIVVSYESESVSALSFVLGVVAASTLFVPFWFVARAFARKHGLTCPYCSCWFIIAEAAVAVRTGRCPKCRHELFSAQPSAGGNAAEPRASA